MKLSKTFKRLTAAFVGLVLLASCCTVTAKEEAVLEAEADEKIEANDSVEMQSKDSTDEDAKKQSEAVIPEEIIITHDADVVLEDGRIVSFMGDGFKLYAHDENGNETPVTWENNSYGGVEIDSETGVVSVTSDVYGSTSYLYFTATSTLDDSVSAKITIQMTGFKLSDYQKNYTVTLSEDGQSAKSASVSGGISGHNVWSYDIPEGVGAVSAEPGSGGTLKFDVYRPGRITYGFTLDIGDGMGDEGSITVGGVALEDESGNRGKVYLSMSRDGAMPTIGLVAFLEKGRSVSAWESSDEGVATVSEDGVVTAVGIGSAVVYAVDSEGARGGIKVVVESEETPYFESLEFMTTAFTSGAWVKDETFRPTQTEYSLPIRYYSTSTLTLQGTTLYDTEKYSAVAQYKDVNGEERSVEVASGASTSLTNIPFDESVLTIAIFDKDNRENETVYTFNISRPRDTTRALKNTSGIAVVPVGRDASTVLFGGVKEGAIQRLDAEGKPMSGTGVTSGTFNYGAFLYDDIGSYCIELAASTAYAHICYSTDGERWYELPSGGGYTSELELGDAGEMRTLIRVLDDSTYCESGADNLEGFEGTEYIEYTLTVKGVTAQTPKILTAAAEGDWYPEFSQKAGTYRIVTENGADAPVLSFTVDEGCAVSVGSTELAPSDDGVYTLELKSSATNVSVTSENGDYSSTYTFQYMKRSLLDVPDKVVDYLAIGSQYTNAYQFGGYPELVLGGTVKSLGNFGGYITFYYEDALVDDPRNKYGLDFYIVGNSQEKNIDSMAELGQVYVSEDNETWYALAGSEHYEDKAVWDYTVTYSKGEDGKAYWSDNYGNSIEYAAKPWPLSDVYYMNDTAASDEYSFTGILFKSQNGTVTGDGTNGSFAASARFGYADYYASNISGTTVKDVNSYIEKPSAANGFDLLWAVDADGIPVDVSDKEFHYVRVATASNIYAGSFMDKSTEVSYVVRTTAGEEAVGKTNEPTGIAVFDGAKRAELCFTEGKTVYDLDVGNMKYISVTVNGTDSEDNIYINNKRVASGESADGFKVTSDTETLIRVIVQSGDCEPRLYLIRLSGDAESTDELIEGIRVNVGGDIRDASSKGDGEYSIKVGHKISEVLLLPIAAPQIKITANGNPITEAVELEYGRNVIKLRAEDEDGRVQEAELTVTRDSVPSGDKSIGASITIYGDEKHGDGESHVYSKDKKELPVWVEKTSYTLPKGSTVADILELCCFENGLSLTNADGNYVSEIGGLWEFDNGPLSGWMYTVNGSYPELGIAERVINNRDSIVIHYTDDFTAERASDGFKSGSSVNIGVITESHTVKFVIDKESDADTVRVKDGEKVSEPKTPEKEGVSFAGWYIDEKYSQLFDFESEIDGDITLYARFVEASEDADGDKGGKIPEDNEDSDIEDADIEFIDVEENSWYSEAVKLVSKNGIMNGISDNEFDPEGMLTRGMLITVLYRLSGDSAAVTEPSARHAFTDVPSDEWYSEAVAWGYGLGIISGISDSEFAPSDFVTREAFATMLYRYAKTRGSMTEVGDDLSGFADSAAVSLWAREAMEWAYASGIVNGTSENTLSPGGTATRAQAAVMLARLTKALGE